VHRHSGPVDRLQHASPRTASLMAVRSRVEDWHSQQL
jgi:hypothetical protein